MVAKLITYGKDRTEVIERMQRALIEYRLFGIKTTIPFHQQVLSSESFVSGNFYTNSLEVDPTLKPSSDHLPDKTELAAIAAVLVEHLSGNGKQKPKVQANGSAGVSSGWKEVARREVLRRG
jgi:acetyl/propionyl-CoA carboxylase alpha subunit